MEVAGRADLRLLPTPIISFTDVRIGDRENPEAQVERFSAEMELAPLLSGEFRIIEMSLERPRFQIDLGDLAGPTAFAASPQIDPARISLAAAEIVEGSAVIVDSRSSRQWEAAGINASIEAGSLLGPARIQGGLTLDGVPLNVDLGFGRLLADGSIPIKASLAPASLPLTVTADGTLRRAPDGAPLLDGQLGVAGLPPAEEGDEPTSPWALIRGSGPFEITPDELTIRDFELSYGPPERPVTAKAGARLGFGEDPRFSAIVRARQIDLDRTLSGKPGVAVPTRQTAESLLALIAAAPGIPVPGSLDLRTDGIVVGGSIIQDVEAEASVAGSEWTVENLSAILPGETEVEVNGSLRTGVEPAFDGHAWMNAGRPAAFASWWHGDAAGAGRLQHFAAEADLSITPGEMRLANIAADAGEGRISGTLTRRFFEQSDQSFVTADLRADRFAVEDGRALVDLFGRGMFENGTIRQLSLNLAADVLTAEQVEARSVVVDAAMEKGTLQLRRVSVGDLAGTSIEARGRLDDPTGSPAGQVFATLRASDLAGAAEFARYILPENGPVRRLAAIAPALTPLSSDVSVEFGNDRLSLDVTGSFADTNVVVNADGTGDLGAPETVTGTADLLITSGDSAAFLAQLGLSPLPIEQSGPARVDVKFDGKLSAAGKLSVQASLAGSNLTFSGETSVEGEQPVAEGALTLRSSDVDPILLMSGFAVPGIGEGHPLTLDGRMRVDPAAMNLTIEQGAFDGNPLGGDIAARLGSGTALSGTLRLDRASLPGIASFVAGSSPVAGNGSWESRPISPAVPPGLSADLTVEARTLDLGLVVPARNASFDLDLSDDHLNLDLARADFAGGTLTGALASTIADGEAQLSLRAAVENAVLQDLVWEREGTPVARGELDGSVTVTGRGRSISGIVSGLAGSGSFSIEGGAIRALSTGAFDNVIRAADAGLELDAENVGRVYEGHLDAGSFAFDRASGSFSISSGVVRIPTVSVTQRETTLLAGGTIDLNTMQVRSEWSLRAEKTDDMATGSAPQASLVFSGPVQAPTRSIDVTPLVGFLTVRAFEQEVERIEKLQAEVLERERLTRLQKLSREEAARREREAAEQAEAEREAAEEAAAAAEREREAAEAREREAAEAADLEQQEAETAQRARAAEEERRRALEAAGAPIELVPQSSIQLPPTPAVPAPQQPSPEIDQPGILDNIGRALRGPSTNQRGFAEPQQPLPGGPL